MKGIRRLGLAAAGIAAMVFTSAALLAGASHSAVTASDAVKWTSAGIPGVSTATVQGDMGRGASHFFLRYAAGFAAPLHHHSPDHYVTTVSGTLVLIVDGAERRLLPGSYFELLGKAPHAVRCEGNADCVMFIDARGAWDVVPEAPPAATH